MYSMPRRPLDRLPAALLNAARVLADTVDRLRFAPPVAHIYNPLRTAWPLHERYLRHFGDSRKRTLFLGMNPGPWGMAQTGVPFGEVAAVRDWMQLADGQPLTHEGLDPAAVAATRLHPKRPLQGLACSRSEVSGRRLWGLMADRFATAEAFFADHFVTNYCPLVFMNDTARNLTPDKLPAAERQPLEAACDLHLHRVLELLQPRHLVGVGQFATRCARRVVEQAGAAGTASPLCKLQITTILHPSPASPAANHGWHKMATTQLVDAGVWPPQP